MKLSKPIVVTELAKMIGAELYGNKKLEATGINEIHQVEEGDISFVDHEKYYDKSLKSAASIIIIDKKTPVPKGKALLVHSEPFSAYNELVKTFRPYERLDRAISASALIHPSTIIEPGAVIGNHVRIGKNCHIMANSVIGDYSIIGKDVIVQPGAIVGSDAFYFKKTKKGFVKWRSGGRVILEDEVDIGATCTVNKGVSGDTVIGKGTKFDSQVHIGHDVRVGRHCLFAGQVGVGGNTVIGNEVVLYGQVGVIQNVTIGDKVTVLAKSGVSKDLESGKTYFGMIAIEARSAYREMAALRHLPEFFANYYK